MRRALDALYLWSGYAAAVFLVAIAATVVAQIVGRFFGVAIDSTESAGFSMAAATFLGLAHTFKQGSHIRVTLLIGLAKGRARQAIELWSVGFGAIGMAYFSYWAGDLVYYSYVFHEISPGLLAVPFWIPRLAMALGGRDPHGGHDRRVPAGRPGGDPDLRGERRDGARRDSGGGE